MVRYGVVRHNKVRYRCKVGVVKCGILCYDKALYGLVW